MIRSTESLLPSAAGQGDARHHGPTACLTADDDDRSSHGILTSGLEDDHGFFVQSLSEVQWLPDGFAETPEAGIFLLDGNRLRTSGMKVLSQLQGLGIDLPVIVLGGSDPASGETHMLDLHALEEVVKAEGIAILVRRLGPVGAFGRVEARHDEVLRCGRLMLKSAVRRAFWDGVDVDLTLGEFKIVDLLVHNVGRHVTYRDIYDCVHYRGFIAGNGEDGYRTNVRSAIKRIRGKFRACDPGFAEIENYTAFGYVWGRTHSAIAFPARPQTRAVRAS